MNIGKIMLKLNSALENDSDPYSSLALSKAIEKLNVGTVSVVATTANVPSANTSEIGEIYLVDGDSDLYINVGNQWRMFPLTLEKTAYAWGYNSGGNSRLGTGSVATNVSVPSVVLGGLKWDQITAGGFFSFGLTPTGTAYAWGGNFSGQLGDGSATARSSPVTLAGGLTWSKLSAGYGHGLGIRSNGVAYGWGNNGGGVIGDGTGTSRRSPVTVAGGLTWSDIAAGQDISVGITTAGTAYAWGKNFNGGLGDGTTVSKSSPVSVLGGLTWRQVSAGYRFCLGLTTSNVAYSWGYNNGGQLGDGTTTARSSPGTVAGGLTWSKLKCARVSSFGITTAGVLYAWGDNSYGRLGIGNVDAKSSPVTVIGGITNWSDVSANSHDAVHTLGVTSSGVLYAWGKNDNLQLGTGNSTNYSSPVTVVTGLSSWVSVSAGWKFSMALSAAPKTL